jgi:hypothetical protein
VCVRVCARARERAQAQFSQAHQRPNGRCVHHQHKAIRQSGHAYLCPVASTSADNLRTTTVDSYVVPRAVEESWVGNETQPRPRSVGCRGVRYELCTRVIGGVVGTGATVEQVPSASLSAESDLSKSLRQRAARAQEVENCAVCMIVCMIVCMLCV